MTSYLRSGLRAIPRAILVLLALSPAAQRGWSANEATTEFAVESWMTERGMPQNSVTALLQTRAGYLWAATYNGIAQFDGERFKVFDSANSEGLPDSRITSLFEDAHGEIWIGHDTGNLTRYSEGRFYREPIRGRWANVTIAGIQPDAQGDLWMVNLRGEAQRIRDGLVLAPPPEMAEFPSVMPMLVFDGRKQLLLVRNGYVAEITPSGTPPGDLCQQRGPSLLHLRRAGPGGWVVGLRGWPRAPLARSGLGTGPRAVSLGQRLRDVHAGVQRRPFAGRHFGKRIVHSFPRVRLDEPEPNQRSAAGLDSVSGRGS